MVRALGAETLNVSFVKTDFTGWMEFIVVHHSVTISGLLSAVICVWKVMYDYFCTCFFNVSYAKSSYFVHQLNYYSV
jgi:hypothetical protein